MADEADSKSVVGNHVWVQVPPPALYIMLETMIKSAFFTFKSFLVLITLDNSIKITGKERFFRV